MKSKAFTIIEILVVTTIIALLVAAVAISYSQLSKQSRDAKRKTDLENIRAALEMYRSNNSSSLYPLTNEVDVSCSSTTGIVDGSITYLSKNPKDPKCDTSSYYYSSTDGTTYTLSSSLETDTTNCGANCITTCNISFGPYGQTCGL